MQPSNMIAGSGWTIHALLSARLKALQNSHRRFFTKVLYDIDINDVAIPECCPSAISPMALPLARHDERRILLNRTGNESRNDDFFTFTPDAEMPSTKR